MRTLALASVRDDSLANLQLAFPHAELVHLSLAEIERTAARRRFSAVVLGRSAPMRSLAHAAPVLKQRCPALTLVAAEFLSSIPLRPASW